MGSVSVVIACHNYGRFLPAAIESVLAQTYREIEVIVVDDGSTDDTAAVAASYRTVAIFRQAGLGQAAAQNRGLEVATGEFVMFLDADDELTPDAVESFVECLRGRPDCAFAYGHVQLVDATGAVLPNGQSRSTRCLEGDPYAHMLRTNNGLRSSGAVSYRSEAVRRAGSFALDVGNAQDIDLNFRLAREHPILCNDRIVLLKRVHDRNATLRYGAMLRGAVLAQRRQRSFVRRHPVYVRDYRTGLRLAQSYWGAALARHAVAEARTGRIRAAARDVATLGRWAPRVGATEMLRLLIRR